MDTRTAPASQPPAADVPSAAPALITGDMEKVPPGDKVPKYKLTERAYIGDALLEVGKEIFWTKKPEHYMHPLNAAARNMYREHAPERMDFFAQLPVAPPPQEMT